MEYHSSVQSLTHVAVLRPNCAVKYFHHYLVLSVSNNYVEIVHYAPGKDAVKDLSVARVTVQKLKFDDSKSNLLDFSSGLFFITRQNYPSNDHEKKMAFMRAASRLGETEYSVSSNNCESFVTWVLTGEATCEQFEGSGTAERVLIDFIDGGFDQGKEIISGLSVLPNRLAFTQLSHLITKSGDKLVDAAAKTGIKSASKVGPSAKVAGVATGITAAVAIPVEAAFCGFEIYKLYQQKERRQITKINFQRQFTKKVSGSASSVTVATGAGFLGTFVGQIVVPIPVLGGLIGGAVGGILGGLVGRTSGSAVSGKIFDAVTDKQK